jgi:hypothetical protein
VGHRITFKSPQHQGNIVEQTLSHAGHGYTMALERKSSFPKVDKPGNIVS